MKASHSIGSRFEVTIVAAERWRSTMRPFSAAQADDLYELISDRGRDR